MLVFCSLLCIDGIGGDDSDEVLMLLLLLGYIVIHSFMHSFILSLDHSICALIFLCNEQHFFYTVSFMHGSILFDYVFFFR